MKKIDSFDIENRLISVYEEIMWLAKRDYITPASARSWYTHVRATGFRIHIRRFTGKVSKKSLEDGAVLRLEHFKRIQTTLTQMVQKHVVQNLDRAKEFVDLVLDCEQVHIVAFTENYEAQKKNGDYGLAKIELVSWEDIPSDMRDYLWRKALRGRVSNAADFFR